MQRADEYELHVVCCLTKPKLDYNVQILGESLAALVRSALIINLFRETRWRMHNML